MSWPRRKDSGLTAKSERAGRLTVVAAAVALLLAFASAASAENYVSLNGGFYFTYPDDWEQIDYNTVDLFLSRGQVSRDVYSYEAVFAPSSNSPFFNGNYLILTVDTVAELTKEKKDSILNEFGRSFAKKFKYAPVRDYLVNLKSNNPNYDREMQIASVLNDVKQSGEPFKKNLLMLKFYEKGVARFFFYSPDSVFESSKGIFEQMINSFSTENLDAAFSREDVKVADIEVESSSDSDAEVGNIIPVAVVAALVVVLIALIRRKRARQN
jgi:hypothetical protein